MSQMVEGTFQSSDGHTLYRVHWLPDGSAKAIILLVHGIGEHCHRYDHVADFLVQHGYAVYALDHRGHGRSTGLRSHFDSFDDPVNDLKRYFDLIQAEQPGQPIIVYGHSMGSLISLLFTLRYQSALTGLIISGTPLQLESESSALQVRLSGFLQRFFPTFKGVPAIPASYLTHDPDRLRQIETDPLMYKGNHRLGIVYGIIANSREVRARLAEISLPLLVLHGADDKLCPPSGATTLYEGAVSADKTLKIYPGLYHEIHNEPEYQTVLTDIVTWLDARAVNK